jgi:hypothetical protein
MRLGVLKKGFVMQLLFAFFVSTLLFNFASAESVKDTINSQLRAGANPGYGATAKDPRLIVMEVIKIVLSLLGTIFIVLFILSSYWYVTAQGDQGKIDSALSSIKSAIIGFIIILGAYSITYFVGNRVAQVTSDQPAGPEKAYETQACRDSFWNCF